MKDQMLRWLLLQDVPADELEFTSDQITMAIDGAVGAYSRARPRQLVEDVTLTAGYEWPLPDAWVPDFSVLQAVAFPVVSGVRPILLRPEDFYTDQARGVWGIVSTSAAAGQAARLYYTVRHSYDAGPPVVTTIPDHHLEDVARFGAGELAEMLSAGAVQTTQVVIGAGGVSFADKAAKYAKLADRLKKEARERWGVSFPHETASWHYMRAHGELIY